MQIFSTKPIKMSLVFVLWIFVVSFVSFCFAFVEILSKGRAIEVRIIEPSHPEDCPGQSPFLVVVPLPILSLCPLPFLLILARPSSSLLSSFPSFFWSHPIYYCF